MKLRRRLALTGLALAAALAAVVPLAPTGQAALAGRKAPQAAKEAPRGPSGLDPLKVGKGTPPGLVINDPTKVPDVSKLEVNDSPHVAKKNGSCYLPSDGVSRGYQDNCYSNGEAVCCYELAGGWVSHYGVDPYNGQGYYRYVYIIDEMEGTRASEWLQWYVATQNQQWFPGNAANKRPYFLYYTGSYLRSLTPAYGSLHDCQGGFNQFIEFCLGNGAERSSYSYSSWNYVLSQPGNYNIGKVGTGDAVINAWVATAGDWRDPYVEYSVIHEFGHLWGLAHDRDCNSVMTYCGTVGNQYLLPTQANLNALNSIYDAATTGPYSD